MRTHVVHAARRGHEVHDSSIQLDRLGLPAMFPPELLPRCLRMHGGKGDPEGAMQATDLH